MSLKVYMTLKDAVVMNKPYRVYLTFAMKTFVISNIAVLKVVRPWLQMPEDTRPPVTSIAPESGDAERRHLLYLLLFWEMDQSQRGLGGVCSAVMIDTPLCSRNTASYIHCC